MTATPGDRSHTISNHIMGSPAPTVTPLAATSHNQVYTFRSESGEQLLGPIQWDEWQSNQLGTYQNLAAKLQVKSFQLFLADSEDGYAVYVEEAPHLTLKVLYHRFPQCRLMPPFHENPRALYSDVSSATLLRLAPELAQQHVGRLMAELPPFATPANQLSEATFVVQTCNHDLVTWEMCDMHRWESWGRDHNMMVHMKLAWGYDIQYPT